MPLGFALISCIPSLTGFRQIARAIDQLPCVVPVPRYKRPCLRPSPHVNLAYGIR